MIIRKLKKPSNSYSGNYGEDKTAEDVFLRALLIRKEKGLTNTRELKELSILLSKCKMFSDLEGKEEITTQILNNCVYSCVNEPFSLSANSQQQQQNNIQQSTICTPSSVRLLISARRNTVSNPSDNNIYPLLISQKGMFDNSFISNIPFNTSNTNRDSKVFTFTINEPFQYFESNNTIQDNHNSNNINSKDAIIQDCNEPAMNSDNCEEQYSSSYLIIPQLIFLKILQGLFSKLQIVVQGLLRTPQIVSPYKLSPLAMGFKFCSFTDPRKIDLHRNIILIIDGTISFARNNVQFTLSAGSVVGLENASNPNQSYTVIGATVPFECYIIDRNRYNLFINRILEDNKTPRNQDRSNINNISYNQGKTVAKAAILHALQQSNINNANPGNYAMSYESYCNYINGKNVDNTTKMTKNQGITARSSTPSRLTPRKVGTFYEASIGGYFVSPNKNQILESALFPDGVQPLSLNPMKRNSKSASRQTNCRNSKINEKNGDQTNEVINNSKCYPQCSNSDQKGNIHELNNLSQQEQIKDQGQNGCYISNQIEYTQNLSKSIITPFQMYNPNSIAQSIVSPVRVAKIIQDDNTQLVSSSLFQISKLQLNNNSNSNSLSRSSKQKKDSKPTKNSTPSGSKVIRLASFTSRNSFQDQPQSSNSSRRRALSSYSRFQELLESQTSLAAEGNYSQRNIQPAGIKVEIQSGTSEETLLPSSNSFKGQSISQHTNNNNNNNQGYNYETDIHEKQNEDLEEDSHNTLESEAPDDGFMRLQQKYNNTNINSPLTSVIARSNNQITPRKSAESNNNNNNYSSSPSRSTAFKISPTPLHQNKHQQEDQTNMMNLTAYIHNTKNLTTKTKYRSLSAQRKYQAKISDTPPLPQTFTLFPQGSPFKKAQLNVPQLKDQRNIQFSSSRVSYVAYMSNDHSNNPSEPLDQQQQIRYQTPGNAALYRRYISSKRASPVPPAVPFNNTQLNQSFKEAISSSCSNSNNNTPFSDSSFVSPFKKQKANIISPILNYSIVGISSQQCQDEVISMRYAQYQKGDSKCTNNTNNSNNSNNNNPRGGFSPLKPRERPSTAACLANI